MIHKNSLEITNTFQFYLFIYFGKNTFKLMQQADDDPGGTRKKKDFVSFTEKIDLFPARFIKSHRSDPS